MHESVNFFKFFSSGKFKFNFPSSSLTTKKAFIKVLFVPIKEKPFDFIRLINAFKEASNKLRTFIASKESYEDKLKRAEYKAIETLIEKLQSWSKIRDWDETSFNDIKQYDDVQGELKHICSFETKRAVKKSPKFKVKDELEFLEEQAKNVLYSGRDIMEVWKYLGSTFEKSGIPVAAPKSFLQIESK